MTAFNEYDGVPASGSKYLLTDVLRDQWGFTGFVMSDGGSLDDLHADWRGFGSNWNALWSMPA